ncbi:hypothetical protein HPB52_012196 [Rhipicephalus sanguineus]|uniref:Uncharacterized protein n=1 Tax=Rhipicephalus sanguineus TaxID=34632 RepID=A0A9D4PLT3_RHISA|nr:hypothetical protein HPB52_012196 [Rhipicephalus sanguineus]
MRCSSKKKKLAFGRAAAPTVNGDPIKNTQPRSSRMDLAGSATNPTGPDAQEDARPSADDLADILASPHPSHPYDTLKAAIISRKSESEHSRLQQLITATELGDRRPSQLLRRMRQLLGGPSAPQEEKLLRELFLQRLPQSMVPVLVAAGDVPVDTLAEMADRVADYSRAHSLNAVTTPPPATAADPALASIENRLDALVRRLDGFVPAHRRPSSRFQIPTLDAHIQACPLGDSYGSRSTGGSPVAPQNAALVKEEEVGIRPRGGCSAIIKNQFEN